MSWTLQSSNSSTALYSSATGQRLLRVFNSQISTSTDYGVTWSTGVSVGSITNLSVAVDSTMQYVIAGGYVTPSTAVQLYRSTDFGSTFSPLSNSPTRVWQSLTSDSTGQYLAGGCNGFGGASVYYSLDYGSSWSPTSSGIDTNYIVSNVRSSSDGQRIIATGGSSQIRETYVSSDYGANFTKNAHFSPEPPNYIILTVAMNSTGQYAFISITNNDYTGIYKSIDYGVTWTMTSAPALSYGSISVDSTGQYILISSGNAKQIYLSENSGSSWTLQTTPSLSSGSTPFIVRMSSDHSSMYFTVTGLGIYLRSVVQVPCFKEGSKILTDKGYVEVQHLRKGDLVKTLLHGYVPINMIGYREMEHSATEDRNKDQLYKCSPAEYSEVFEDLVLTGCHSILVEEFKDQTQVDKTLEINGDIYITDNKYRVPACADDRASVYEIPGKYTIYHLALDNEDYYMNYGIYANGLLVETCSKRYLKELSNMQLIE
jgi:Hint domain